MLLVPTQAIPNQRFQVQLGNQSCAIALQQTAYGLFFSLYLGIATTPTPGGVLCQNLNRLVRDSYLGFSGDLVFQDTQGSSNPDYTGLGPTTPRYQLIYLTPDDLAQLGFSS